MEQTVYVTYRQEVDADSTLARIVQAILVVAWTERNVMQLLQNVCENMELHAVILLIVQQIANVQILFAVQMKDMRGMILIKYTSLVRIYALHVYFQKNLRPVLLAKTKICTLRVVFVSAKKALPQIVVQGSVGHVILLVKPAYDRRTLLSVQHVLMTLLLLLMAYAHVLRGLFLVKAHASLAMCLAENALRLTVTQIVRTVKTLRIQSYKAENVLAKFPIKVLIRMECVATVILLAVVAQCLQIPLNVPLAQIPRMQLMESQKVLVDVQRVNIRKEMDAVLVPLDVKLATAQLVALPAKTPKTLTQQKACANARIIIDNLLQVDIARYVTHPAVHVQHL
eukprot:TRINITY_DN135739_c0_g1_i1.p4 TRINITY_DN135739_c0_g1~~TRINITY_DN135739_c0_g1_i1.p4  ORF type:complete len:340 (-),score=-10.75 TRINITY_DN135739_c0_g1_i1:2125-3144(-)